MENLYNSNKILPISESQKRFFLEWLLEPSDSTYNVSLVNKIKGEVCKREFKEACELFIERNEIVFAQYTPDGEMSYSGEFTIDDFFLEFTLQNESSVECQIRKILDTPFDLTKDVLLKLFLINGGKEHKHEYYFIILAHHIIADAISAQQISTQIQDNYNFLSAGQVIPLKSDRTFSQAVEAERKFLDLSYKVKAEKFWLEFINDIPLNVGLPYKSLPGKDYDGRFADKTGGFIYFELSQSETTLLKAYAREKKTTLFIVLSAAFGLALSKYCNQERLLISYPINTRPRGYSEVTGCFVNNIPLKFEFDKAETLDEQINLLSLQRKEVKDYQGYSLTDIIRDQRKYQNKESAVFFNIVFAQANLNATTIKLNNLEVTSVDISNSDKITSELGLLYDEYSSDRIKFKFEYRKAILDDELMERFVGSFKNIVNDLINGKNIINKKYCVLNEADFQKIIYQWNNTDKHFNLNQSLSGILRIQAEKLSEKTALVYKDQQMTYKELNEKSNQLARYIRSQYELRTKKTLQANKIIALYLERGIEMMIAICAVLKAGAAYLPIDTALPQNRVNYMLEDSGAELILCNTNNLISGENQLPEGKIVSIDLGSNIYVSESIFDLPDTTSPADMAYLIYTSGTTGKPKGVMIAQRSVINYTFNVGEIMSHDINNIDFSTNLAFDLTVTTTLSSLILGKTIFIYSGVLSDIKLYARHLTENKIDLVKNTPSLLSNLPLEALAGFKIKLAFLGGEKLQDSHLLHILNCVYCVVDEYGPTEATIGAFSKIKMNQGANKDIGKPYFNYKAYVLCTNGVPLPIGVIGELHLAGDGLAMGYLNLPEFNASRFIFNPYATEADIIKGNNRLYKTGDFVRWLPDGNLEYIGRKDNQVKINGFRIELSEVENAFSQLKGIRQSCVLVKERNTNSGITKYLAGYYSADQDSDHLDFTSISEQLSKVLPGYMVPVVFIKVEIFPLTSNGKLDKQALPEPEFNFNHNSYVPPITKDEIEICNMWQKELSVDKVGMNDDFFRMGGDSMMAIRVSWKMSKVLGFDVKVSDIFKYKSIFSVLSKISEKKLFIIPKSNKQQALLSYSQERLWFIEQYERGTNAYHLPALFELESATDISGIEYAIRQIIMRHEVLRSTIEQSSSHGFGIQQVHTQQLNIEIFRQQNYEECISLIKNDINRPFNLGEGFPIRVSIYEIKSENSGGVKRYMLVNVHHIAGDGWSADIFINELNALYHAYINNDTDFKLPELEIQYSDYASWQREYLTGDVIDKQLNYWKEKLSGYQTLMLPTDRSRPSKIDYHGLCESFSIDAETSNKLRSIGQSAGVSIHNLLLSSISILFSRYTGQEDIVTGSPVANRHHGQTEGLIGFFVNTQVNRILLNKSQTFEELIIQTHSEQANAQLYQDLPFERLVNELAGEKDTSRHPVFQVMFGVQSFGDKKNNLSFLAPVDITGYYEIEKFDLTIFIDNSKNCLEGTISYATSLFDKVTIKRLIDHYQFLLRWLSESPNKPYSQANLLSKEEYNLIVHKWNERVTNYPRNRTIHELFLDQVSRTPYNSALVYDGRSMTYSELNNKTNQLARHIRNQYKERRGQPLTPDKFIALYLDKSFEMVIGILAILKSGAAYVPMDTSYPDERIEYIIGDTDADLLLCTRHSGAGSVMKLHQDKIIYIDLEEVLFLSEDASDLPPYSTASDLAYVIYTSGTTGRPKGVLQTHGNVMRLFTCTEQLFNFNDSDVWTLFHSYVFDFTVWELWGALLYGGKLIIINSNQARDTEEFYNLCKTHKVTVLNQTPSAFYRFADIADTIDKSDLSFRYIIFGGEALNAWQLETWWNYQLRQGMHAKLINMYGITETTVHVTYKELSRNEVIQSDIGRPIPDLTAFVLDRDMRPVPVGVEGELYIGGAGLARGYLNRPELTSDRFIPNPYLTDWDLAGGYTRLYKTGDVVRWLHDGNLEYKGRNDDQVKIRGYRIELGEIESVLSRIPGIRQSCVLARVRKTFKDSTKYLAAYYVPDEALQPISAAAIIEILTKGLPAYMIPEVLVAVSSFPLTINGKLNRDALPEPDFSAPSDQYSPPITETQILVGKIWQDVLGVEKVGIFDDFFRIGGNSILAIQVSHRMSQEIGHGFYVADLFRYRTIAEIETLLLQSKNVRGIEIEI